jgi:type IV secretory pathway VirB3-like protein
MVDTKPCSVKVRRSLLQRDMFLGIPTMGLMLLFVMAMVLVYAMKLYLFTVPIALLYFIMRFLTSKDSWMIDIVLGNAMQKDVFIP